MNSLTRSGHAILSEIHSKLVVINDNVLNLSLSPSLSPSLADSLIILVGVCKSERYVHVYVCVCV